MVFICSDAEHSGVAVLIGNEGFDVTDVKVPKTHGRRAVMTHSSLTNSIEALIGNPIAQMPATALMPVMRSALDVVSQSKRPGRSAPPTVPVISWA